MVGMVTNRPRVCKVVPMATQAERRESTRGAIVDAAQKHFIERGYDATSVSEVLESAGVSRGAMYHHFAAKEDVFAAVFVRTSSNAIRRAVTQPQGDSTAFDVLIAGCLGWLRVATEPEFAQVLLVDGPAVLGWQRCRSLEEATSLGVMRRAIAATVDAGEIVVPSVDVAAKLINAVLAEAALGLVSSPSGADRSDVERTVVAMINAMASA